LQLAFVVFFAQASGCVATLLPPRTVSWHHIETDAATILAASQSTRSSIAAQKWQALQKDLWTSLVLQNAPDKEDFDLKKYDEITKSDFVTACRVTFNVPKFAVPAKVVRKNCLEVGGDTSDCRGMVDNLWKAHKEKKFQPWCESTFDFFAKKTEPKCPTKCKALFCKPRCDVKAEVKDIDVMEEALEYKMKQTVTRRKNLATPEEEQQKIIQVFNKSKGVPILDIWVKAKKSETDAEAKLSKAAKKLADAKKADEKSSKEKDAAVAKKKGVDDLTAAAHKAVQEAAAAEREETTLKGQLSEVKDTVKEAELLKTSRSKTLDEMKSSLASAKKAVSDHEKAFGKVDKRDLEDMDALVEKKVKAETIAFEKVTKAETAAANHQRAMDTFSRRLDSAKQEQTACKTKTAKLRAVAQESEKAVKAHEQNLKEALAKHDGDLSKSIKESKKGLAAQAKKVKEVEELMSELSSKVSAAKTRVSSAEHKIDIMKRALKAQNPSKEKRQAAENRIKVAEKSFEDVKKILATLEKRQETLTKLKATSTKSHDDLMKELKGLEAAKVEVDQLEVKLNAGKEKLKGDKKQADNFETSVCKNMEDSVKKLADAVKGAKDSSGKLKKDVENAKKELATAQAETKKARKAASSLKQKRKEVQSVTARLKAFKESKVDTIITEHKRLTDKQKELEGSLKESSADAAKAKSKKEKAEKAAKEAQEKLDKELAKAQKEMKKAGAALKESSKEHSDCAEAQRKAKAARMAAEKKYAVVANRMKDMQADFMKSNKDRAAELAKLKKREQAMQAELDKLKEKKKTLEDVLKPRWKGLM